MSNNKLSFYAAIISQNLDDCICSCNAQYNKLINAMKYSLNAGGKHLRGAMLLECAKSCGTDIQLVMPFAVAIEIIHTYSLIHDDLPEMDNSEIRRNRPSCHIEFGQDIALLAGDGLLSYAVEYICTHTKLNPDITLNIINLMMSACGPHGMLAGQTLDKIGENTTFDFDQLVTLQQLKTGKLFEASCLAGCIAAGATPNRIAGFKDYSRHFGLAFQIKDDLLDVEGSVEQLGKPIGHDAGKNTFVKLLGKQKAKQLLSEKAVLAKKAILNLDNTEFFSWLVDYIVERKN